MGARRQSGWGVVPIVGRGNSFVEMAEVPQKSSHEARRKNTLAQEGGWTPLTEVEVGDVTRYRFAVAELDRVLGGGGVGSGEFDLLGGFRDRQVDVGDASSSQDGA